MEINKENYYSKEADKEYMSYSQFKKFEECPAKAMAILNGTWQEEQTDRMLVGSYIDAWLDGELMEFCNQHPEIHNTRTGELKSQFRQAQELCATILKDDVLFGNLKGERQRIITGNIAGVKFKGKIDSLNLEQTDELLKGIHDGKVLKDCEDIWKDGEKLPFYLANGYDKQAAIYQTLYQQMFGEKLPFYLDVITKEKTPDKRIFKFSDKTIEDALQRIIAEAPVFDAIKKGEEPAWNCGKCDYCRNIKQLTKNDVEEI